MITDLDVFVQSHLILGGEINGTVVLGVRVCVCGNNNILCVCVCVPRSAGQHWERLLGASSSQGTKGRLSYTAVIAENK